MLPSGIELVLASTFGDNGKVKLYTALGKATGQTFCGPPPPSQCSSASCDIPIVLHADVQQNGPKSGTDCSQICGGI